MFFVAVAVLAAACGTSETGADATNTLPTTEAETPTTTEAETPTTTEAETPTTTEAETPTTTEAETPTTTEAAPAEQAAGDSVREDAAAPRVSAGDDATPQAPSESDWGEDRESVPPKAVAPGETPAAASAGERDATSDEPPTASDDETTVAEPPAESDSGEVEENKAPTTTYGIISRDVAVGETIRVHVGPYFADPDGDPLRYEASSSDESVVAASASGSTVTITGVGAGAATVTVTAHDPRGLSIEQSFDVKVTNAVMVLEMSGAPALSAIGETAELGVTAEFADGSRQAVDASLVRWESSDAAVVTVSDGVLTAAGGGVATVTAAYEQQSAEVAVSVRISTRETGTVRVLYAVPVDREFRADHSAAIGHALVDIQSWYRRQLDGLTFSLYDVTPEYCPMDMPADFYVPNSWDKVLEGVQHCAPVGHASSEFVWVVYADVGSECDDPYSLGRGGAGLTMVGRDDLEGLVGNRLSFYDECGRGPFAGPLSRWIGGMGHELGHAFGLPHPPGCDDGLPTCDTGALLQNGYESYPSTYLRFDDKEALLRSAFIDGAPPSAPDASAGRRAVVRGTVVDPDGTPLEGVRLSLSVELFWSWTQSGPSGTFEITLSEDASGSAVVSVHAGQAADCRWLGYHAPEGLTTARDAAAPVTVSGAGATEIRIELPAQPDDLCRAPRSLRGTVVESDGTPARGLGLAALHNYATIEPDGTFEIPPPEIEAYQSILSIYDEELGCGLLGYYGADGFTTRREEAVRFEVGPAIGPGIELTLPANRRDLCDAQELLTGTVRWPNGEPAEGTWLYAETFETWVLAGPDGAFELRLPRASPPSRLAVLASEAAGSCWLGYHRPAGLTIHADQATQAEAGTAVRITLPAGPDELCNQ